MIAHARKREALARVVAREKTRSDERRRVVLDVNGREQRVDHVLNVIVVKVNVAAAHHRRASRAIDELV